MGHWRRYSMSRKMKDSGIEWIGEIPEDWDITRLKNVLCERKENNNLLKTDFILSLTNDRGVIPYSEKGEVGNKSKEDLTGYKLAYPNDIVLNSMNVVIGSVGISNYFGAVSPVYYMLYPRDKKHDIRFFNYIFQTKVFQESLKGYGNGIMEIRMRIQMSKLNTVMLPLTNEEEQNRISNYLDYNCTLIDQTIEKQKQVIEKLKDYKSSYITEIVRYGFDKNVELKDSYIQWMPKVPKHWDVTRIKNTIFPLCREVLGNDDVITCFRDGQVTLRKNRREEGFTISFTEHGYQGVEIGDLVIHGMDAFAGSIGCSDSRGKCTPVVHVCKTIGNNEYFMYFLRSMALTDVFMSFSNGVRIRSSDFRNFAKLAIFPIVVPPIEEQNQIVNILNEKCDKIEKAIDVKKKVIEKLEAYKKSLIYECVTGKREVN